MSVSADGDICFYYFSYVSDSLLVLLSVKGDVASCVPGETDLQCVPGRFESVEGYIRVFEPLLFEECRAQLFSTWEELTETFSRDTHVTVRVRNIERRERGNNTFHQISVSLFKESGTYGAFCLGHFTRL